MGCHGAPVKRAAGATITRTRFLTSAFFLFLSRRPANASRKDQFREAKALRKAAKPDWELVEEAKRIYNVVKPNDAALVVGDRESLVQELLKLIKGRASQLVLKHDASRIVQTCVKHGTVEQRQAIIEELKPHLLALTKSRYGKFLASKLFIYGSKEQRLYLIEAIRGKARKMIKQKDSAEVLETAFSEVMNSAQRQQVLFEIYAPELAILPDSKPVPLRDIFAQGDRLRNTRFCDDLQKLTDKWVQKELLKNSVVHGVLWEYCQCIPLPRQEAFIQGLRDLVIHFAHTSAGSKVAHFLVSVGTAKDRKIIIKGMKSNVADFAIDEHGVWPLMRVLDCVDDTKLVSEAILRPALQSNVLASLLTNRWGALLFLQVLAPLDKHYFAPDQLALVAPATLVDPETHQPVSTSKKPADVRRAELLATVVPPLVQFFTDEMDTANIDEEYGEERLLNNKWSVNVLYELMTVSGFDESQAQLLNAMRGIVERHPTILEKFHTSRMLKRVIHSVSNDESSAPLKEFADNLWDHLVSQRIRFLQYLIRTKGAGFVVVAYLDNKRYHDRVVATLKPLKKKIAAMVAESAAAKIIAAKL